MNSNLSASSYQPSAFCVVRGHRHFLRILPLPIGLYELVAFESNFLKPDS